MQSDRLVADVAVAAFIVVAPVAEEEEAFCVDGIVATGTLGLMLHVVSVLA